ncbi:hypothetical protein SLEP1_g60411, partial [Rubroshorea leprosula]
MDHRRLHCQWRKWRTAEKLSSKSGSKKFAKMDMQKKKEYAWSF